jgi:hypothetical protein
VGVQRASRGADLEHAEERNFGTTFKNEGQCVSFVATGGKKQPKDDD